MRNGRRCSTAVGYLKPARRRPNLLVQPDALATRVLFEGRRAVGVEYRVGDELRTARAAAEVILAGGAFNSPQLLQLSGLGPAALLQEHGIAVVADVPGVGADLQDHYQGRLVYRSTQRFTLNDVVGSLGGRVAAGLRYGLQRRGMMTLGAIIAGGFFRTDAAVASPNIQGSLALYSLDTIGGTLHAFSGFTGICVLLRPESRGSVRIKSRDPRAPPAIALRYLSAPKDREDLVAGFKALRKVFAAAPLRPFIADEHLPGAAVQSDADLLDYIRQHGSTVFPPHQQLSHGRGRARGRRRALARARHRGAARRRRLGDADRGVGEHQRGDDHDRRKGIGHDPRGRRATGRSLPRGVTAVAAFRPPG